PGTRTSGVTPASWQASAICAAESTPIVLCSMSMNAKSNPHAASTRPMSTVRACRSAIPNASWPAARRSLTVFSICVMFVSSSRSLPRRSSALLEEEVDVLRRDQVGHRPAVEVVLGHALLGEAPERLRLAARLGHVQGDDADGLRPARVVALVQLVPPAELGPHGVPEELHQLDALDGAGAVGAAQVLVEVGAQRRRPEVGGVRVQIDEGAPEDALGQLLDAGIRDRREDAVRLR